MQIGLSLSLTAQLRSSSTYAVLGYDPALVFDFKGNYFRKSATDSTFGASITHTATTNATMVDSDGLLKWRPHNLLTHSGDLNNAGWANSNLTIATGQNDFEGNPTAFKVTPTAVSAAHLIYKATDLSNLVNGILTTVTIDLKADGYNFFSVGSENNRYAIINLSDGTVSLDTGSVSPTVTSLGNGWYRCSITTSANLQEAFSVVETPQSANYGASTFTGNGTSGVLVAYPHTHRSDLGGMVNNPDASTGFESYVPTTTSAVYLSRRGHHIYNGSAWVNEGILHESEARTNLLTYSNDFANAAWFKTRAVVAANSTTSPSGATDADLITTQSGGWAGVTWPSVSITSGTTYTGSIYAKANGYNWLQIGGSSPRFAATFANVNLSDGSLGNSNIDVIVTPAGNGWYRIALTAVATQTTSSAPFFVAVYNTDVASRLPDSPNDGTSGIYLYGTQFEIGSTASSYIPTAGATVTRAAETLTVPAANLPYDSTNVSIQIDGKMTYADTSAFDVLAYNWQLGSVNYIRTLVSTVDTRTGQPVFAQRQSTSGYDDVSGGNNVYSPDVNVPFNIAARHGSTFINGAHEGTLLTANTTPTVLADLSSADLDLGYIFMGTIGQFRMWDEDITDAGITEAST